MRNSEQDRKTKGKILILNIAIVLLALILIPFIFIFLEEWKYSRHTGYKENTFAYRLEDGRYGSMVEYYHENEANHIEDNGNITEYYAVARFYEAALYYKAFLDAGDDARAAVYAEKMKAAQRDLGSLEGFDKKILKQLELTQP